MIISWNTTNKCNLKCSHCYRDSGKESQGELNTEEAKQLIDEIAKANFKIMIFSGGEPFMRDDIFELINHASKARIKTSTWKKWYSYNKGNGTKIKRCWYFCNRYKFR